MLWYPEPINKQPANMKLETLIGLGFWDTTIVIGLTYLLSIFR